MENACLSQESKNSVWGNIPEQSFHRVCGVMLVPDIVYLTAIQQEMFDTHLYITTDTPWNSITSKEVTVRKVRVTSA